MAKTIKYPLNYALGEEKMQAFPKVQYEKIKEIIDALNGNNSVFTTNNLVVNKNVIRTITPYTATPDNNTGWTLAGVKLGLLAGGIKTTSVGAITLTLDSVANIITSFSSAGVTLTTGSVLEFLVDNSQGANTVTVAVDGGATIAVATPAITGGATLTVSTANKIGMFQLYLTSPTTAILSRLV